MSGPQSHRKAAAPWTVFVALSNYLFVLVFTDLREVGFDVVLFSC